MFFVGGVDLEDAYAAKEDVSVAIRAGHLVYTVPSVACEGAWSECTASCGDATYVVSTQQRGDGVACPARAGDTAVCFPGDGDCPGLSCQ